MGCGCKKDGSQRAEGATEASNVVMKRQFERIPSMIRDNTHTDTLACEMCLVKHLSKALVEYSEYLDDSGRTTELALCIGDMACAEDHAKALGMMDESNELRNIRHSIMLFDRSHNDAERLRRLASAAAYDLSVKNGVAPRGVGRPVKTEVMDDHVQRSEDSNASNE